MVQETFARFFRILKQYRHYGKAANYLYVIVSNACRDYYRQNREQPVEQLLGQVGLTAARNKKMKKLSGGMKRRAGIAQAMLGEPKILILDEPTAGLDPNERIRFRYLIGELAGTRLVLSTHIVSDVRAVCILHFNNFCFKPIKFHYPFCFFQWTSLYFYI